MCKCKLLKKDLEMIAVSIFPIKLKSTVPKAVLAGVASFLIQKDTQERTTVRMQGM